MSCVSLGRRRCFYVPAEIYHFVSEAPSASVLMNTGNKQV